jgi:hypothetical protein
MIRRFGTNPPFFRVTTMLGMLTKAGCVAGFFAATFGLPSLLMAVDGTATKTIAVAPFQAPANDASLVRLAPIIADVVAGLLAEDHGVAEDRVAVVERKRLAEVLAEQKLQASGLVDAATAVRVGRLLGADLILTGTLIEEGAALRLVLNVITVADGRAVGTLELQPARDRLAEELVAAGPRLAKLVDVRVSTPAPDQLDASPLGGVHFLRGVSCYNARLPDQAIVHLLRAVQLDPRLVEARLWIARAYLESREPDKARLELTKLRTHSRAEALRADIDGLAREIDADEAAPSGK